MGAVEWGLVILVDQIAQFVFAEIAVLAQMFNKVVEEVGRRFERGLGPVEQQLVAASYQGDAVILFDEA